MADFELPTVEEVAELNRRQYDDDVVVGQDGSVMSEKTARATGSDNPAFARRAAKANHGNGRR